MITSEGWEMKIRFAAYAPGEPTPAPPVYPLARTRPKTTCRPPSSGDSKSASVAPRARIRVPNTGACCFSEEPEQQPVTLKLMRGAMRSDSVSNVPLVTKPHLLSPFVSDTDDDPIGSSSRSGARSSHDDVEGAARGLQVPTAEEVTSQHQYYVAEMPGKPALHYSLPKYMYPSQDHDEPTAGSSPRRPSTAGTRSIHARLPNRQRFYRDDWSPDEKQIAEAGRTSQVQKAIQMRHLEAQFNPHACHSDTQHLKDIHLAELHRIDAAFEVALRRDRVLMAQKERMEDELKKRALVLAKRSATHHGNRRTSVCLRQSASSSSRNTLSGEAALQGDALSRQNLPPDAYPESRRLLHHAAVVQRRLLTGALLPSDKPSVDAVLHPNVTLQSSRRCVDGKRVKVAPKRAVSATIAADEMETETIASVERFERMHRMMPMDDD